MPDMAPQKKPRKPYGSTRLQLEEGLEWVMKATVPIAEKAVGRAGVLLLTDSTMQVPKTPHDTGTLRSSGSVIVSGKAVHKAPKSPPRAGSTTVKRTRHKPAETSRNRTTKNTAVAEVGFNTPYAARVHEGVDFKFVETGTGAKFMQAKMSANKELYGKEMARTIEAELAKP